MSDTQEIARLRKGRLHFYELSVQQATELAALRERVARLEEAASNLLLSADEVEQTRFSAYKARNGRMVSVQADDGERVDLVHSEQIHALKLAADDLRAALSQTASTGDSGNG